ncbi:MAG: TetR/AcrR family transcriptional regulator [Solirubrobacterales bacterium]|nr:TetR/AcrR family transcriptional regulator [Solirubrobacterales bacterium]
MTAEPRPLRADAERNRRRVLDAARDVFARRGLEAGVDEIARCAGVGVGTLYRRFPTKQDLLAAVIEDGFVRLMAALEETAAIEDPWASYAAAAHALGDAIARDRGFHEAVQAAKHELVDFDALRAQLLEAVGAPLSRAQAAGVVRGDLTAQDLLSLCAVAARLPEWRLREEPAIWRRYLSVVLDGTRPEGATPLPR